MSPSLPSFIPAQIPFLALPWVPVERRNAIPFCSAVYFIVDGNGKVLYVGQSQNLPQRWLYHERLKQCRAVPHCRIAWLEVHDHTLLTIIENACIDYFQPPWNGHDPQQGFLKRLSLSLPLTLYTAIVAVAKSQRRSLHAQILLFLEQALDAMKGPTP